jgi:succinoglycan biosynthesis transport protein ExoP
MLQFNRIQSAAETSLPPPEGSPPAEIVTTFVQLVYRQFPMIVMTALLTTALGILYLLVTPATYNALATMIIDTKRPTVFTTQTSMGDLQIESAMVSSQVEILKSEKIAISVINNLELWKDPEFAGPGRGIVSLAARAVGRIFSSESAPTQEANVRHALDTFQTYLNVRRVNQTNVIEVNFRSQNPERAIQIANAIVSTYIMDQLESRSQSAKQTSTWLQDRVRELREQALVAEQTVVKFKKDHNIVGVTGKTVTDQQLTEINSQLVLARTKVSEAQARLDRIEAITQSGVPDATVTDTLASPVVTKLRTQYLDLANREADWSVRYGPDHIAVRNLQGQMREIRNAIADELRRLAETYKSEYEIAKQREEAIQAQLAQVVSQAQLDNQAQVTLRELESAATTARQLYETLLQRYMESIQQQSFPVSEARIIAQASGPLTKSNPQPIQVLAGSTTAGILLGLLIGFVSEIWRHVFRTRREVAQRLQTNCIAIVPKLRSLIAKPERSTARAVHTAFGPRTIVSDQGFFWHVLDSPMSRFAESIRAIKLAIDTSDASKSNKIIALTSALPREGKSTVGTALAQLLAHSGAKTILVDCNFRHGTLSRMLTPQAKAGILEVVSGAANLEDVVWTEPYTNLCFLPVIANNRLVNSHDILTSEATNALFNKLRNKYEYVIVDLSPLAPIVDARTTTQFIDAYILVIEWGKTRVEDVERALADAKAIHENLLGVVLNKANLRVLARYDKRHRNYHSDRYYTRHVYSK